MANEAAMKIVVKRINRKFHARLFSDSGALLDEMACDLKQDVGWICREMLRWQDKLGNSNAQTKHARDRQAPVATGKIWYSNQLPCPVQLVLLDDDFVVKIENTGK